MFRTNRNIATVIIVIVILALIGAAYLWFSGGSGAPSATLSAPTLAIATRQPTTAPTLAPTSEATSESTAESLAATSEVKSTAEATSQSTIEATAESTSAASAATGDLTVFNISTDESKVTFTLGEILNGSQNTVVGTTNQIAGQIAVDFSNPTNSQIGEMRIDARSLATDSSMRDRMIRGQILQSAQDQYEFISFKPTDISGLPTSVTMGTAISFKVTGDLTIRDVVKPVTFDVTVTPDSQTKITGKATATIKRDDFGLTIPNVPSVTQADEEVKLEINFVANAAT